MFNTSNVSVYVWARINNIEKQNKSCITGHVGSDLLDDLCGDDERLYDDLTQDDVRYTASDLEYWVFLE